jgi:preprotein translocase subunit SecY
VFESLLNAFRAPDIRRRIFYVLGLLIVFRLLASVPIPGVDKTQLSNSSRASRWSACSTCSRAAACRISPSSRWA